MASQMPFRYPEEIPREERSHEHLYPDLDLSAEHLVRACSPADMQDRAQTFRPEHSRDAPLYRADEADLEWIRETGMSEDAFELAVDGLEREWSAFVQKLINRHVRVQQPESACDVCARSTSEEGNALVVCQGCSISVHEDCYGIQSLHAFWLCRGCLYCEDRARCSFCPSADGCLKQTSNLRWGHVTCAMFNRTLSFGHPVSRDPIDVDSYRELDGCMFCEDAHGTAVRCSYFMCKARYHVSCALDRCYFDLNNEISYCETHDPQAAGSGSRRMQSLRHFEYKRLAHPPRIRGRHVLSVPRTSLFMKICRMQPLATEGMVQRVQQMLGTEDVAAVSRHWEARRRRRTWPLGLRPAE